MGNLCSNTKNNSDQPIINQPKTDPITFDKSNFKIIGTYSDKSTQTKSELTINCFNNKFEVYIKATGPSPKIPNSYIFEIYIDPIGNMYKSDSKDGILVKYDFSQGNSPYPQIHIIDHNEQIKNMTSIQFTNPVDNASYSLADQINKKYSNRIYLSLGGSVDWIYDNSTKQTNPKIFGIESATYSVPDSQLKSMDDFLKKSEKIVALPVIPFTFDLFDLDKDEKGNLILKQDSKAKLNEFLESDIQIQKLLFDLNYMELVKQSKAKYLKLILNKWKISDEVSKLSFSNLVEDIKNDIKKLSLDTSSEIKIMLYNKFIVFEIIGLLSSIKRSNIIDKSRDKSKKLIDIPENYYLMLKDYIYTYDNTKDENLVNLVNKFLISINDSYKIENTTCDAIINDLISNESYKTDKTDETYIDKLKKNCDTLLEKIKKSNSNKQELDKINVKYTNLLSQFDKTEITELIDIYRSIIEFEIILSIVNTNPDFYKNFYNNFNKTYDFIKNNYLPPFYPEKDTIREIMAKFSKPTIKPFRNISLAEIISTYDKNYSIVPPRTPAKDNPYCKDLNQNSSQNLPYYSIPIFSSYSDGISDDDNHLITNNDGIGYYKNAEIIAYAKKDSTIIATDTDKDIISTKYNNLFRIKAPEEFKLFGYPYNYIPGPLGLDDTRYLDMESYQDVFLSHYVYYPIVYWNDLSNLAYNDYLVKIGNTWTQTFVHKFANRSDRMLVCYDLIKTTPNNITGKLHHGTYSPTTPVVSGSPYRNIMIVFEGSVDYTDWLSDALVFSIDTSIGTVHLGFWLKFSVHHDQICKSLEIVYNRTEQKYTTPFNKIIFGGHSLGGAIAQIAAAYFKNLLPETKIEVVTHGAPCPFDISNRNFDQIKHKRYTAWTRDECWCIPNTNDPVPTILNFFNYIHTQINETNPHNVGTNQYPAREVIMRTPVVCFNEGSYYDRNTTDVNLFWESLGIVGALYDVVMGALENHSVVKSYFPKIRHAYCGGQYDNQYANNYNRLLNRLPNTPY